MVSKIIHLTYPMTSILDENLDSYSLTGPIVCFDPSFAKQKKAATPRYQLFPVLISPTKLNIQH